MSQFDRDDPIPVDARGCDAIEHVVVPRARDLGGSEVRRALPSARRQMVGPSIFRDRTGPAAFIPGTGKDGRPHPHIGVATVTCLFDGEIIRRHSLGRGQLPVFRPSDRITETAMQDARFMVLGGDTVDAARHIWRSFGSPRKERIEQAKADWSAARLDSMPGNEASFITLPAH